MTDVLKQLRHVNPVDASSLEISPGLRSRALRGEFAPPARRRRSLALALVAVAAGVTIAALIAGGRDGGPDLAARAYAASSDAEVIHWRTEEVSSAGGRTGSHQRTEGWARNGATHELRYDVIHGKALLQSDSRTANGRTTVWTRAEDDYIHIPASGDAGGNPLASGDPMAIFRRAYRTGKLERIGPSRFHVDLPGRSNDHDDPSLVYYDIDPRTALPVRLLLTTPARTDTLAPKPVKRPMSRFVRTFAVYERLSLDQTTRKQLRLLPHSGAGPKNIPAARNFAALRTGPKPDPAGQRAVALEAHINTRMRLDATAARALLPGTYLLPGRGYVCLVLVTRAGSGSGCKAIEEAIRRGVSLGTPEGAVRLVVPDGVVAVRARLRGGRHRRVAVSDNFVRLPVGAYAWQLQR